MSSDRERAAMREGMEHAYVVALATLAVRDNDLRDARARIDALEHDKERLLIDRDALLEKRDELLGELGLQTARAGRAQILLDESISRIAALADGVRTLRAALKEWMSEETLGRGTCVCGNGPSLCRIDRSLAALAATAALVEGVTKTSCAAPPAIQGSEEQEQVCPSCGRVYVDQNPGICVSCEQRVMEPPEERK